MGQNIIRVARSGRSHELMQCYEERNTRLSWCGYASYPEYLASDGWAAIRAKALHANPRCVVCQQQATQVHHLDYEQDTLMGLRLDRLVTLCRTCHEKIEFDGTTKRTLHLANGHLYKMLCAPGPNLKKRRKLFERIRTPLPAKDGLRKALRKKLYNEHRIRHWRWVRRMQRMTPKERCLREQAEAEFQKRQDDVAWLEEQRKARE